MNALAIHAVFHPYHSQMLSASEPVRTYGGGEAWDDH